MFNSIRKFFDAAPEGTPSIASLMASQGRVNTGPIQAQPDNDREPPKEAAAPSEAPKSAETATSKSKEEPASQAPAAAVSQQSSDEPQKEVSLEEVLKKHQPDAVLKALGYGEKSVGFLANRKEINEKMIDFFEHWEAKNGDVTEYLRDMTTDYTKMSPEEVMKRQLQAEYPNLSEKHIEALYKAQVHDAYKLDSSLYSEEEYEQGRLLLEAVASKHREKFIQEQQQRMLDKPVAPPSKEQIIASLHEEMQAERKAGVDEFMKAYSEAEEIKNIIANKKFVIGEGEDAFNYSLENPEEILKGIYDSETWVSRVAPDQKPNWQLQALFNVIASDPQFLKKLGDHYKTIGGKSALAPIENASVPTTAAPAASDPAPKSPAAAMAKGGKMVSGG